MAQHAQDVPDPRTAGAAAPLAAGQRPATTPFVPIAERLAHRWPTGLRPGCHRLVFRPDGGAADFHGTLRVDEHAGSTTVSGDLYRYPRSGGTVPGTVAGAPEVAPASMSTLGRPVRPLGIPAHPPGRYHSYLRATGVRTPTALGHRPGAVTIVAEEYRCTDPATGAFAATPRVVTITLDPAPRAPGYTAIYRTGTLEDDGAAQGRVTVGWVSRSIRAATVALTAATTPLDGRDLRAALVAAGWQLSVGDRASGPASWAYADAHALLSALRVPATAPPGERVRHQLAHLPDAVVRPA